MIIKYVNNFGESVNLNEYPYKMLISNIFDYDHDIISNENKIIGFTSAFITDRELAIDVHRTKEKTAFQLVNALTDIFQKDILVGIPGRLYIDDWYLSCFFKGRDMNRWDTAVIISLEYEICFEKMVWIKEETYYIPPIDIEGEWELLEVPASLPNTNFTDCHYRLRAYGPFPSQWVGLDKLFFYVGDNQVQVDYTCKDGEYIELDTRNETISLVNVSSGSRTNIYHLQNFNLDTFRKIPPGENVLKYDRSYAMEITLFHERSEPRWNEETPDTYYFITTEDGHPLTTEDGYYIVGAHHKGGET